MLMQSTNISENLKSTNYVTRKIRFEKDPCVNEGWLIVTASRIAAKYHGYVIRYKIRSYGSMSSIVFRCPRYEWIRLHAEFLGETNGKIDHVRCRI